MIQKAQEHIVLVFARMSISIFWVAGLEVTATLAEEAVLVAQETLVAMAGYPTICSQAYDLLARAYLYLGKLAAAEAAAQTACQLLGTDLPIARATHICTLLLQGRSADAIEAALHGLHILGHYGCIGRDEVELRLAISESFQVGGQRDRAHVELREALRQVQLRADDISDPFWKNSYLTRNPSCIRTQELAREWGLDIFVK